jgi:CheY-like chemotaxis protein
LRILVAEDDPSISTLYSNLLRDNGHGVILTKDGEECLICYNEELRKTAETTDAREHIQPFGAVILDHKMPKMNGLEVAKEIVSVNPHQRIIIASAYSSEIFDEAADTFNLPLETLQKPFWNQTLIDLLEDTRIYEKLMEHFSTVEPLKKSSLRHEQLKKIVDLFEKNGKGKAQSTNIDDKKLSE